MVDPNPARGMPLQLQRYWLVGKGGIKIRWNTPGDFLRCVRALTKYFPKDPKGLCNILHTKATGGPPGHGSLEKLTHSSEMGLTAAAALLAKQPQLGKNLWAGPLAPINRPTGEPRRIRIFEPGSIKHRDLPLPLGYRRVAADGHQGAVTVGRIMGVHQGPDHKGQDWMWGWGDWLDEDMVPEVKEARYMVDQGIVGPSVDPGGPVRGVINPETGAEHTTQYTMGGATLVAIPAFASMRVYNLTPEGDWPDDDDPDMAMGMADEDPGCDCASAELDPEAVYTVNPSGWRGLPLAPREAVFDNDDAVKRIAAWAGVAPEGTNVGRLRQAFLWSDPTKPATDPTSYRMPVGDIINDRLVMVYHAIYAAAALISGAHGGLPDVSEPDKAQLRNVITDIYGEMAKSFNDASVRAPWDRPETQPGGQFAVTNPNEPYGDVKYADPGYQGDKKKRYPIDTPEHVRAAWGYINQPDNAKAYNPKQLQQVRARIIAAAKKLGIQISETAGPEKTAAYAIAEGNFPIDPPMAWFSNPRLGGKTALTVTPEGQVYGHLAAWGECHRDVTMRECVMAPKSRKGYAPFHLGRVFTAEGEEVAVGKIVMDTRHADIDLGYASAALHYDDTGDEVAVVRAGEDQFGIWVAGAVVPEATPAKVAKLRRSPLSGDWRRVENNLELTAALAVNVPAFPVYAMDGEDRLALVAAGTVYPDEVEEAASEPYFGIEALMASVRQQVKDELAQEDRAWRFRELIDEDDTDVQQARIDRLAAIYAADDSGAPLPAPAATAPIPAAPPVTGAPGAVAPAPGAEDPYGDQAALARQVNAQYSVIQESDNPPPQTQPAPAPEQAPAPTAPAPAPAAPAPAPVG